MFAMKRLVLLLAVAAVCSAQFLDGRLFPLHACFSTSAPWATNVLVASQPTGPVDIIVVPTPYKKFEIYCLEVFENGPILSSSLQYLCSSPHKYLMCTSPVLSNSFDRNWTCSDITAQYSSPISTLTIGAVNGPPLWIKLQWSNSALGSACFPMYLTTMAVMKNIDSVSSTLATTIAFSIIGAIVFALAAFFGVYQCRKLRAKFGAKRHALNRPPTTVGFRPDETAGDEEEVADGGEGPVDLYGEHTIAASGVQRTELAGEGVVLESRPLVKPWYERENFRQPAAPGLFEQTPVPEQTRALRHRRGASPEQIDFSPGAGALPSVRGPQYASPSPFRQVDLYADPASYQQQGPKPNEEMVMVCTDCFRALQDPQTPQFCTVTGMRHY